MKAFKAIFCICIFLVVSTRAWALPGGGRGTVLESTDFSCDVEYQTRRQIELEFLTVAAQGVGAVEDYTNRLITVLSLCMENGKHSQFMPCDFDSIETSKITNMMSFVSRILAQNGPFRSSLHDIQVVRLELATWGYLNYFAGVVAGCFQQSFLRNMNHIQFAKLESLMRILSSQEKSQNPVGPLIPAASSYVYRWSQGRDPDYSIIISLNGFSVLNDERHLRICVQNTPYSRVTSCPQ